MINVRYQCLDRTQEEWDDFHANPNPDSHDFVDTGDDYALVFDEGSVSPRVTPPMGEFNYTKKLSRLYDAQVITVVWLYENGIRTSKIFDIESTMIDGLVSAHRPTLSCGGTTPPPPSDNRPPTVELLLSSRNPTPDEPIEFFADASDPDGDDLTYEWFFEGVRQTNVGNSPEAIWEQPEAGTYVMEVVIRDGNGGEASDRIQFTVSATQANDFTVELILLTENPTVETETVLRADVTGAEDADLTYTWFIGDSPFGIVKEEAELTRLLTPSGTYTVQVIVTDEHGAEASASLTFKVVKEPTPSSEGDLVVRGESGNIEQRIPISEIESENVKTLTVDGSKVSFDIECFKNQARNYYPLISYLFSGPTGGSTSLEIGLAPLIVILVKNVCEISAESEIAMASPQQTAEDMHIRISLPTGEVAIETLHGDLGLVVETNDANAMIQGLGQFTARNEDDFTTVEVTQGQVFVVPANSDLPTTTLKAGSAVDVGENDASSIRDIGTGDAQSLTVALDVNANGTLEDAEINQAIQYWILGQTVPGTDETISDAKIRELIQLWITGAPISTSSAAGASALARAFGVDSLRWSAPSSLRRELVVRGRGLAAVAVRGASAGAASWASWPCCIESPQRNPDIFSG